MVKRKIVLYGAMLGMAFSVVAGPVGAFATGANPPAPTTAVTIPENVDEEISVVLHKKQFGSAQSEIKNDGKVMNQFTNAKGLNGVTFKVYDVTSQYLAALATFDSTKTNLADVDYALAEVQKITNVTGLTEVGNGVTSKLDANVVATPDTTDDEDGILKLNLPLYSGNDTDGYNYAVYLFMETAGENVTTAPLAVAFPIVKEATDTDKRVHLYPKNVINERKITLQKVATDNSLPASLDGATFTLQNSSGNYYTGYDEASQTVQWGAVASANSFVIDNGKVVITGLTSGTYTLKETVAPSNGSFEMTAESQSVVFKIDKSGDIVDTDDGLDGLGVVFEDKNAVGEPTDEVDLSHKAAKNTIVVENRKLVDLTINKIEYGTNNPITGAEFHIAKAVPVGDAAPDYLYVKDQPATPVIGEYEYKWHSEFNDGTDGKKDTTGYTLVTLDGHTDKTVSGLLAGTYFVHEAKAPVGFVQPTGAAAYTEIGLFSGTIKEIDSLKVDERVGESVDEEIENMRKGALPSTGGSGIAIFLVTGAVVMAGAVVISRRNRDEAEEI